ECVPYFEKVFTQEEQAASGNALAFARDYQNSWLIRSLVSIGLRTENHALRARWASEVIHTAPATSADYGAALCILAYEALAASEVTRQTDLSNLIDQYVSIEPIGNPNVLRWKVSLSYVQGLTALARGDRNYSKQCFKRVIAYPVATYSPTLLTKPAEAAYLLGLLYAADGELSEAESVWSTSLASILKDIGQYLYSHRLEMAPGFELREISAVVSILGRLVVAIGHVQKIDFQPTVFFDQVSDDLVAKLPWLTSQREAWERVASEREQSIVALQAQVQDLLTGNAWLTSQREAWERVASEREQSIVALQAQVQDLLTGNAWLTSQREAWERVAAEREQSIVALTSQLQEVNERLSISDAMLLNIRNHPAIRFVKFCQKLIIFNRR
ncbi:MAG: hypothetical protein OJI67_19390, partial [Prosthecobacter sp.]|nr:hypothetical protein [Prosthecobacter sp.]